MFNKLACFSGLEKDEIYPLPTVSKLSTDTKWVSICGGDNHTLSLDNTGKSCFHVETDSFSPFYTFDIFKGKTYALGRNEYGRLGLGKCGDVHEPTAIPGLEGITSLSCGSCVSFAVTREGM